MAEIPERPIDAEAILRTFARHGVDFVVIGGFAVQTHGHLRTTKDLDIIPRPSSENLTRLGRALGEIEAELGGVDARLLGIDVTNARELGTGANFTLTTRHGWLDVFAHDGTPGAPPYEDLRARALEVEVAGVAVAVASLDDLIRLKRAAGREIDLRDIAALTAEL